MKLKLSMQSAVILSLALPVCLAAPRKPQRDDEIVERLPRGLRSIARDRKPDLGSVREYVRMAQTQGDPRYAHAAEGVLGRLGAGSAEAHFLQGVIDQHLHRFAEARAAFEGVLRDEPGHAEAILQLSALHVVQGRFKDARELLARNPQLLGSARGLGMVAVAASLSGQLDASIALLRRKAGSFEGPEKAWLKSTLAEMEARRGDLDEAEALSIEARTLQPDNLPFLVQWADLLLQRGRFVEAATFARSEFAHTGMLLRSAVALARLGRESELRAVRGELRSRLFDTAGARHLREQALFTLEVLNEPNRALALAVENFEVQREPIDVRLVLEAALRADESAAAAPVVAWLKQSRLEDCSLALLVKQLKLEI